jgi:hypothetical protein
MKKLYFLLCFCFLLAQAARAEEGMYPINTIDKAGLKKAGLKMNVKDIYNPNGQGLIKAVVQIGGCTGSFVSDKGLIVTNHHCAFGGLEPYSNPGNNLLEKGYLAQNNDKELSIKGLTCRILVSHQDVSPDVLKGTDKITDAVAKKALINKNMQAVKAAENLKDPSFMLDVSEMLPGKSYMLFRYFLIKDLRIVYIPARNIGEFGGESDNWEWPRHTGDFSFVRAYVSKEGKGADYSKENVPYHPEEYLNISAKGMDENDFVFIVGYPGRTFRHQPADFLKYQQDYTLPYISELYGWEINTIKSFGSSDPDFMIKNEPKIKQLANVEKNYQGKLKTMRRINLYNAKKKQENDISAKLSDKGRQDFQKILSEDEKLYALIEKNALKYMWYNNLFSESKAVSIARDINSFVLQFRNAKNPIEKGKSKVGTIKSLRDSYKSIYTKYDSTFLRKMLADALLFKDEDRVTAVNNMAAKKNKSLTSLIKTTYTNSKLLDSSYIFKLINNKPAKLARLNDPLLKLVKDISIDYFTVDSAQQAYKAQLDALLPQYVDLQLEAMGQGFIPDANRSLRLTYGYIRGYTPKDAVYCSPFTTASGMIQKNGGAPDYNANLDIINLLKKNDFGRFKLKNKNDLPLCMLYDTDTTGGNSGSPVLNANGQLVAINFDRCFEATINDYAWDESYSRSIGVDIRFVLWTTSKVAGADYLLKEMFIEN